MTNVERIVAEVERLTDDEKRQAAARIVEIASAIPAPQSAEIDAELARSLEDEAAGRFVPFDDDVTNLGS
jgi:hypothetical protein